MSNAELFIEELMLEHAASRYDPRKAHEYYLRTRELKGRRSGKGLSTQQKEGWSYVKDEVGKEKTAALAAARQKKTDQIEQLRGFAETRRDNIREKLQAVMERLTERATANRERISDDVQAQIDRLPPIPKGVSKEVAARLSAERRDDIAKIRATADKKRQGNRQQTKDAKDAKRDEASSSRAEVKTKLKASIETARGNYEAAKERIKAKYESELDAEYQAIRNNVR